MSSQPSPATLPTNSSARVVDYLTKQGRLKQWGGLLGLQSLQRAEQELAANREAESAHVRRTMWGESAPAVGNVSEEPMGDTTLGDKTVTTHTHHYHQQSGGGVLKGLVGAGLLASGIGLPIGAWMIADAIRDKPPAAVEIKPPPDSDTLFDLRLGEPIE